MMFAVITSNAPTSPVSRAVLGPPRRTLRIDFDALAALADALAQHCGPDLKEQMREDAADLRNVADLDPRTVHNIVYRLCSRIIRFRTLRHTIIVAAEEKAGCPGMVDAIVRYFATLPKE
jgi:hypothetical protein